MHESVVFAEIVCMRAEGAVCSLENPDGIDGHIAVMLQRICLIDNAGPAAVRFAVGKQNDNPVAILVLLYIAV